jgi:hypothetical protein
MWAAMNLFIADTYPEAHLERFKQLGCRVTYEPGIKASDLPKRIAGHKILIVRGKQVSAETLKAGDPSLGECRALGDDAPECPVDQHGPR